MNFEHFISTAPVSIRRTLVADIQEIISQHRGWLNQVSQAAVNRVQSLSPQIEDKNAETLCAMGLWVKRLTTARLAEHPSIKGIIGYHNAMHRCARDVNDAAYKNVSTVAAYESFLIEQFNFFSDMNALLEISVRDQALFHHTSRMIRSQHTETMYTRTIQHLQSQPSSEQCGCVAYIDADPKRNIERHYHSHGLNVVVSEVAARFKKTARQSDAIIEGGNSNIILLFPGMGIQHAKSILERIIQQVINHPIQVKDDNINPSLAIGVVGIDIEDIQGVCLQRAKTLCIEAAGEGATLKIAG